MFVHVVISGSGRKYCKDSGDQADREAIFCVFLVRSMQEKTRIYPRCVEWCTTGSFPSIESWHGEDPVSGTGNTRKAPWRG